ncbi:MAG: VanW family protein [Verrucomicrobia bacterium]|nr:VanW family protein [Verrucomicrobiota bacterium]
MNRDLPREIRRWLCQGRRLVADRWQGLSGRLVSATDALSDREFPVRLTLEQPILVTDRVAEKRHNLDLARRRIDGLVILPGSIFSFWHLVGKPSPKRGFQAGRSLLGGELRPDFGGGLCQLSGAIYHLSLLAGLRVLERHAHSVDIYADAMRHTPLGADATVAYGFKDLRIENTLPTPVCFRLELRPAALNCALCSPAPIEPWQVDFVRMAGGIGMAKVETFRYRESRDAAERIAVSCYATLRHAPPHRD